MVKRIRFFLKQYANLKCDHSKAGKISKVFINEKKVQNIIPLNVNIKKTNNQAQKLKYGRKNITKHNMSKKQRFNRILTLTLEPKSCCLIQPPLN